MYLTESKKRLYEFKTVRARAWTSGVTVTEPSPREEEHCVEKERGDMPPTHLTRVSHVADKLKKVAVRPTPPAYEANTLVIY